MPARHWTAVLFALWLGQATNFMMRSGLAPALVSIRADLRLSYAEGGLLATGFLIGYLAAMLPGGLAGDQLGRRRIVIAAAVGWCLVTALIGLAPSFLPLLGLIVLLGSLMGIYQGNDRAIAAAVIPRQHVMIAQSVSFSGLGVGSGVGILLAGFLVERLNWRGCYLVLALLGLGAVVAFWRLLPEPPRSNPVPIRVAVKAVLRNRNVWLMGIGGFPTVSGIWILVTWAPTILLESDSQGVFAVSLLASAVGFAALPALAGTGMLINAFEGRWLTPRGVVVLLHVVLVPVTAALAWAVQSQQGLAVTAALMVAASFLQWAPWGVMWAIVAATGPRESLGLAVGFTSTLITIGTFGFPWFAGAVRDASGSFAGPFMLLAALTAAAAVLLTMVDSSDQHRGMAVGKA